MLWMLFIAREVLQLQYTGTSYRIVIDMIAHGSIPRNLSSRFNRSLDIILHLFNNREPTYNYRKMVLLVGLSWI